MKNTNFGLALICIFLMQSTMLFGQTGSKFSFDVEAGIIYSDLNFGNEYANEYLKQEDYRSKSTENYSGLGFDVEVGLLYKLGLKNELKFSTGYVVLSDKVDGKLDNLNPFATRMLSSGFPVSVDGCVNYSFLNFGGDIIHSFNGNNENGYFVSIGMDYLLNLNTNWDVDVEFETGNRGVQNSLSDIANTDLNNIIATNIRIGYNLIVNNNFRVSPSFGLDLGLNGIGEDSLFPSYLSFNLRFNPLNL